MTATVRRCEHCQQPIELHYPTPRSRYAYWRHIATERRVCVTVRKWARPEGGSR